MSWAFPRSPHAALLFAALTLATALVTAPRARPQAGNASAVETPATAPDTFQLHGVVVDSRTGKPIVRALVQAYGGRLATFSDRDGRFSLEVRTLGPPEQVSAARRQVRIGAGIFVGLTARKPGYVAQVPFQTTMLAAAGPSRDLQLKLTPESVLEGHVAASGDDHPENVRVFLLHRLSQDGYPRWTTAGMAVTNSRGEYRFPGLTAGEYRLSTAEWTDGPREADEAVKPGSRYAPVFYPAGEGSAPGSAVPVGAGEDVTVDLHLHAEMFYPVRIPVWAQEGTSGLSVRVGRNGDTALAPGFTLHYNGREKRVEGVLPSGNYDVALRANSPSGPWTATLPLVVRAAATETAPVRLAPGLTIPVIVHEEFARADERSSRMPGGALGDTPGRGGGGALLAQVALTPAEATGASVMMNLAPQNGAAPALEHVPPGTYRVTIYLQRSGYAASAQCGGTDLLREPLVVSSGGSAAPIEIVLRDDVGRVTGRLQTGGSGAGDEAAGVRIAAVPAQPSTRMLQSGMVGSDGSFALGNLAPGKWWLFASRESLIMREYRSEEFLKQNASRGVEVTVEPNGTATATLTTLFEEEP